MKGSIHRASWAAIAATLLCVATVSNPAAAAASGNETFDTMFCIQHSAFSACYHGAAQTLTADIAGHLSWVELPLARPAFTTQALTVEIRAGTPDGALLATSNLVPASAIPIGNRDGLPDNWGWIHFTFASPVSVEAGDPLAIVIAHDPVTGSPDPAWGWGKSEVDVYPNGMAHGGVSAAVSPPDGHWDPFINGSDLAFRTSVNLTFTDIADSMFKSDIEWAFLNGITSGCAPALYCPDDPVSREQMASFLARALDLSGSAPDAFTDDETSIHEPNINLIAADGIASGCGSGKYCPKANVTRGQMAAFLHRAFGP